MHTTTWPQTRTYRHTYAYVYFPSTFQFDFRKFHLRFAVFGYFKLVFQLCLFHSLIFFSFTFASRSLFSFAYVLLVIVCVRFTKLSLICTKMGCKGGIIWMRIQIVHTNVLSCLYVC